jgi:chemotaxis protein histidine kinase CheA
MALVEHLPKPGLDLRKAFGFVRDDVLKNTGYKQEPYVYGSLGGDDMPLVAAKPAIAGPQPNPEDAVRRDYELALQLGVRAGWNAFLARYPAGFYSDLARGQLNKIAAEEARAAAADKARLAEQEKARLAAEGAKKAEQEKAATEAKAAEEARLAAEEAKQIAQAKAEAAEQARVTAEKALAERIGAEKTESERKVAEKAATERAAVDLAAKQVAEAVVQQKREEEPKLASLPPPSDATAPPNLAKSLQLELRRVGCLTAAADGDWNSVSQHSLSLFNQYAGQKFDVQSPGIDALDAVKGNIGRICPVVCESGYRANGDRCVKITCRTGYARREDDTCQKIDQKNIANRKKDRPTIQAAPTIQATPTLGSPSAIARADAANKNGTYKQCMGALPGCYERALPLHHGDVEAARSWCSRRPTC